ncbi:hypothetical protein CEY16_00730 [Halalkalibacillus sediminis]|uniref:GDYXXLXY protein n=1 Tax=Halalkalibacillus sediminis TaxID=2018042 RepID=A0A2I0QVF6_9BACI|nr:GDYXXLXY domain-containing protein [Halalkalibacillus sediminis]PKR78316.1 hypothetical protein CEY16_00730 [Halalkalibacillus sediminis]
MRKKILIFAVAFQVLFLISMAASSYFIEEFGKVIKLQTEPNDPRDVFYGDYTYLNYSAETIRPENWFTNENVQSNQVIYVLLTPNENNIHQVKAASDKRMDADEEDVIITARYSYQDQDNMHHVNFGVNRFYGEGHTDENFNNNKKRYLVEIALSPWGQKKILNMKAMEE